MAKSAMDRTVNRSGDDEMTYGWIKKYVLQLINRYSLSGETIDETYNDQKDYLNRIPALVNDAVMYIATAVRRIPTCVRLDGLEHTALGDYDVYTLPQDCYQVKNGILYSAGGKLERMDIARFIGDGRIAVAKGLDDGLLEYYRYPNLLGDDPSDDETLDNSPHTHTAVAFYAAAHLMLDDNEFGYTALHNEFETRIARLYDTSAAETSSQRSIYAAGI